MLSKAESLVSDRTVSEDRIDCVLRASVAIRAVTERIAGPKSGDAAALAEVLRRIVRLARNRDANEIELRVIETCIAGVIDDLFTPGTVDLHTLRRMESDADRAEDASQDLLGIERPSRVLVESHVNRLEKQGWASLALARAWRRHLRQEDKDVEVQRTVAIDRLTGER